MASTSDLKPRDNQPPDISEQEAGRLAEDYGELSRNASALLEQARAINGEVTDEATLERFSNVIVDMRDTEARAEAARVAEKEPFLRRGQAVDGFFGSIKERLAKGRAVLKRSVDAYQNRKLAEERERRRLAEEQARREAQKAADEAARLAREAEDRRLAAERARLPETQEAKGAVAEQAETAAAAAQADAQVAIADAQEKRIDSLAKPSEMARSRFDEGRLVTMRQVGYAEIVDKMALDPVALWPFIKEDHALAALKAWAKTSSFKKQMTGAVVEMRDESVIR
jgi:hypothetical protein